MKYYLSLLITLALSATMAIAGSQDIPTIDKSNLLAQSSTSSTQAVGQPVAQSVTQVTEQDGGKLKLPITITDTSFFFGPAVNDPGADITADSAIDAKSGLSSRHIIGLGYKISDTINLAPTLDFNYQLTDPLNGGADRGFTWNDAYLKLSYPNAIKADLSGSELTVNTDARYYAPTSKTARDGGTIGALRVSVNPSIQFGKSKFSLSTENYAKYWIQPNRNGPTGKALRRMEFYTGPQLNYQVSEKVSAFVLYEAIMRFDTFGVSDVNNPNASLSDVEPGLSIKLTDRIEVSPFLNWYVNQSIETTSLNLAASIKLL